MAESASNAPSAELLEFPKKDKRRMLHAVYRVGDLERSIKYVAHFIRVIFYPAYSSFIPLLFAFLYQVLHRSLRDEITEAKRHT